jgi:phospholipid/cholesterol/gamma-HCH transport system substrate-binding protein
MKGHTLSAFIKLVVFAVVTTFITLILAFTIANGSTSGGVTYKAEFTDVTSLLPGDDVRIAGVRVGQVKQIKVYHQRYALVTFDVQRSVPVRVSTLAQVRYRNLVGQRYIELSEGPGPDQRLAAGSTIPLSRTQPALDLTVLFDGFRPLFKALTPEDVNKFAAEIIATLQGEGGTIDSLLAHTASVTNTVADRDAAIGSLIDNLTAVLATVDTRSKDLDQLIVQMQQLVTGLAGDRDTIAASLGNVNALAESTAGLLRDIRPVLPGDLANLSAVAKNLATTKNSDGQITMEEILRRYPDKLNAIIRTATYGSWFNFWLCDADGELRLPNGSYQHVPLGPDGGPGHLHVSEPACNASTGGGQ